jgi:hypothetical protein
MLGQWIGGRRRCRPRSRRRLDSSLKPQVADTADTPKSAIPGTLARGSSTLPRSRSGSCLRITAVCATVCRWVSQDESSIQCENLCPCDPLQVARGQEPPSCCECRRPSAPSAPLERTVSPSGPVGSPGRVAGNQYREQNPCNQPKLFTKIQGILPPSSAVKTKLPCCRASQRGWSACPCPD